MARRWWLFRTRSVTKDGCKTHHHKHGRASDTVRGFRVRFIE